MCTDYGTGRASSAELFKFSQRFFPICGVFIVSAPCAASSVRKLDLQYPGFAVKYNIAFGFVILLPVEQAALVKQLVQEVVPTAF